MAIHDLQFFPHVQLILAYNRILQAYKYKKDLLDQPQPQLACCLKYYYPSEVKHNLHFLPKLHLYQHIYSHYQPIFAQNDSLFQISTGMS